MIKTKTQDDKNFIITGKNFDYSDQAEFRKAYESFSTRLPIVVDMRQTEFLDSAALGMLLILREYLGGDGKRITIANPRDTVLSILTVSNFQKIFNID